MKERPIIFSAPMILALLRGDKKQTRRVVKPVRGFEKHNICVPEMAADPGSVWWHGDETDRVGCLQDCPYGEVGDHLWVKEAWHTLETWDDRPPSELPPGVPIRYQADGGINFEPKLHYGGRYRHARYMPRWASRITLEITGVRVERVQDINEADAQAEGANLYVPGHGTVTPLDISCDPGYLMYGNYREGFQEVWSTIYADDGPHGWNANPWVWVIEFKQTRRGDLPR